MDSFTPTIPEYIISRLCIIGINYHQADIVERGNFSINEAAYLSLLNDAKSQNLKSLFVLSTCNRTELYSYCEDNNELIDLFTKHTNGTYELFNKIGFTKRGEVALNHLFKVGAGLDSQIIGDYEILSQLKTSVAFARANGMIGPIMDRTINFVLQASKTIKTQTQLSTGTVSVSYAAIEWLKKEKQVASKKILLFGTGKFGTNVVKNLKHYFKAKFITAINRTNEAANKLAFETGINWKPFNELKTEVKEADIIIVCTNAGDYTILPSFFCGEKEQLIFDLSVPANVHADVRQLNGIRLVDIDEVSQIMHKTFARRNAEIPKALEIIDQFEKEFYEWLSMYQHSNLIQEMKYKLFALTELQMPTCEMANTSGVKDEIIHLKVNKAVNSLASNLRLKKEKGCQYINTFHEFLKPSVAE